MAQRSDKTIKVCLTNRGHDSETPWAQDLGPASGAKKGSRKVRLVNVPFLHAKPTYGDVVIVTPVEDGLLTWDRDGIEWTEIGTRITEDGGRWAMIIDYVPHEDVTGDAAFQALAKTCEAHDLVCEGAWGPDGTQPGRAYLAVDNAITAAIVMAALADASVPATLVQIHPVPAPAAEPPKRWPRAATVAETPLAKARAKSKPRATARPKAKTRPAATPTSKAKPKPAAKTKAKPAAKPKAKRAAKPGAKARR